MNTGGEAAEQIVRMSLEGFEVAAKITGAGAKNIAVLLYSILKEEKKTKGKARLTNMLRSGKELKVFTVKNGDLKKFTQEAKKYGVLYCVLADRGNKDPNAEVDVIARAEDASKISRIAERFKLASEATALPMFPCQTILTRYCRLCVPVACRSVSSCKIWHSSKPCLKSNGKASWATAMSFCIWAATSKAPISMCPSF